MKIYKFNWLLRDVEYEPYTWNVTDVIWMCPKCRCRLSKSKEPYSMWKYKYDCIQCEFKTTLNKSIEEKWWDFLKILDSVKYKDADIINLDWDLIRVQREWTKDNDYRIDAKISKNKKWQLQLMVLAWSKKESDKTQLFVDPTHERFAFDQNDSHPKEIFSKVVAIFKDSTSTIWGLPDDLDF